MTNHQEETDMPPCSFCPDESKTICDRCSRLLCYRCADSEEAGGPTLCPDCFVDPQ